MIMFLIVFDLGLVHKNCLFYIQAPDLTKFPLAALTGSDIVRRHTALVQGQVLFTLLPTHVAPSYKSTNHDSARLRCMMMMMHNCSSLLQSNNEKFNYMSDKFTYDDKTITSL